MNEKEILSIPDEVGRCKAVLEVGGHLLHSVPPSLHYLCSTALQIAQRGLLCELPTSHGFSEVYEELMGLACGSFSAKETAAINGVSCAFDYVWWTIDGIEYSRGAEVNTSGHLADVTEDHIRLVCDALRETTQP